MSKQSLLGGVAAVALFATTGTGALAADLFIPPVEPAPVLFSWTGFYVGGHVGYGEADFNGVFDNTDAGVSLSGLDVNGLIGGVHAGYNWQLDGALGMPLVFGVEGDISFADWEDTTAIGPTGAHADVDFLASIRGRLGLAFDRFLIYGTGGVAFKDASVGVFDLGAPTASTDFDDIGGVVGGGIEWAWTDNILLRGEGLYYIFDDSKSLVGGTADPGDFAEFNDAWVVRAGVSIKLDALFGGPPY